MLPGHGKNAVFLIAMVILIYVFGIILSEGFPVDHPEDFINNIFFLASTGVIGLTAYFFKERIQQESFFRNIEIQRSVEVIKRQLESKHNTIEDLAHEIVHKTTEAQDAVELRDRFMSMASHELRTPLAVLKLQQRVSQEKLKRNLNYEAVEDMIKSTDTQIARVLKIVEDMLDVSRIQSGKFSFEKSKTDIVSLVSRLLSSYYPMEIERGKIVFNDPEEVILVACDLFKIEQVFINLINNAIRHGGEGVITISVFKDDSCAVFSVKDEGAGIPAEDIERIFDKFERGTVGGQIGGLGLGLFICREIMRGHDGSLQVENSLENGAIFIGRLPLALSLTE